MHCCMLNPSQSQFSNRANNNCLFLQGQTSFRCRRRPSSVEDQLHLQVIPRLAGPRRLIEPIQMCGDGPQRRIARTEALNHGQ